MSNDKPIKTCGECTYCKPDVLGKWLCMYIEHYYNGKNSAVRRTEKACKNAK